MPTNTREKKPVVDAVNDAVAALSDLVRSLRHRAASKAPELKKKARTAAAQVKDGAREAGHDVRRAGHSLRVHFERAWRALKDGVGISSPTGRTRRRPGRRAAPAKRTAS